MEQVVRSGGRKEIHFNKTKEQAAEGGRAVAKVAVMNRFSEMVQVGLVTKRGRSSSTLSLAGNNVKWGNLAISARETSLESGWTLVTVQQVIHTVGLRIVDEKIFNASHLRQ